MTRESTRSATASMDSMPQADSVHFLELQAWFQKHVPPYSLDDLRQFSNVYERHRRRLSLAEKRRMQSLLDALIQGVE